MKITENKLRRIIKRTINEISHDALGHMSRPDEYAGMGGSSSPNFTDEIRQRAHNLCYKNPHDVFEMCIKICESCEGRPGVASEMARYCLELCRALTCDGEAGMNTCCDCLYHICSDRVCLSIVKNYCGC